MAGSNQTQPLFVTVEGTDRDAHDLRSLLSQEALSTSDDSETMALGAGEIVVLVGAGQSIRVLGRVLERYVASKRTTVRVRSVGGSEVEVSSAMNSEDLATLLDRLVDSDSRDEDAD